MEDSQEVNEKSFDVPIVKIVPAENVFSLVWQLTNRCNWHCMYCSIPREHVHPDDLLKTREKTLDELKDIWRSMYKEISKTGLDIKISITGGEPTINKDLYALLKWLRTEYKDIVMVGITTNSSASANTYKKLFEHLEYISMSLHTEHANIDEFLELAIELGNHIQGTGKTVHLNLMDEYWLTDRAKQHIVTVLEGKPVNYTFNTVYYENRANREEPIFIAKNELLDVNEVR
jgi:MoaA/NifB/PqqE/SkfB family radical SAM enzyme